MVDELISLDEEQNRTSLRQCVDMILFAASVAAWLLAGTLVGFIWAVEWFDRGINNLGYTFGQKELIASEIVHEMIIHNVLLLWAGSLLFLLVHPFILIILDKYGERLNNIYIRTDKAALVVLPLFIVFLVYVIFTVYIPVILALL